MKAVWARDLRKTFRVRERAPGLRAALWQLVRSRTRELVAVDGVSFEIARGERVAFVGPNGAGKSTTLKMLSGILHPSAGELRVAGLDPVRERRQLGYRIATVFGQRSQLWYHLPAADTYELLARVYDLDAAVYRRRRDALIESFGIADLIARPVRQLSLGERMRCELVASLLHDPEILFLDEPTIGLDVTAKAVIRDLIRDVALSGERTVLLTSHDTGDMEQVCERVLVIHRGRLLLDQSVESLRRTYIRRKHVTLRTVDPEISLALPGVEIVAQAPHVTRIQVDLDATPVDAVVKAALEVCRLEDLTVEDPPMEQIVAQIYARAEGKGPGVAS